MVTIAILKQGNIIVVLGDTFHELFHQFTRLTDYETFKACMMLWTFLLSLTPYEILAESEQDIDEVLQFKIKTKPISKQRDLHYLYTLKVCLCS